MLQQGLAPGLVIAGKYVVERPLGHGGMGAVYVVSHAQTGKRMAMKTLLPEFVHDADIVSRFLREAQVMGRLHHRHVVDVFDVGRDGDVLFIVMELLEGKPLGDLLKEETLTLEEALVILLRTMEGVSAAHDQGVVHRDLKPDNIFVCIGTTGRLDDPRVLDFGISKLDDPRNEKLTRSGVAMGTPYYMSIEQLNGQRDLDARVDVYAMGVILYEAIAGDPPFLADSMSALAIRVLTTEPVHLGTLRRDLPEGLADVVMKAISRNRDERPRSMRALIEALRPFLPRAAGLALPEGQSHPLRTPRSGGQAVAHVRTTRELVFTPARKPWGLWVAVALTLALGAAGAAVLLRSQKEGPAVLPAVAAPSAALPEAPPLAPPPPVVATVVEPPAEVDAGSFVQPAETPSDPARGARKGRSGSGKDRRTIAPAEPVAPSPAAAAPSPPAPANTRRTAEGRAGKLGSDEF
jgi:eukaryotic-like serine/threonine-protein kinase